jgi:hypothetical protein
VNRIADEGTPRFDVQLIFDEIGVALDNNQYRDTISLLDMYHFYIRQRQVSSSLLHNLPSLMCSSKVSKVPIGGLSY